MKRKARLNHDDRINLQAGISKGYSLKQISIILDKSRSTIYREIINNCYYKDCRHTCFHCKLSCTNRNQNYHHGECIKFIAYECEHWKVFPYTCNNCKENQFCSHRKRYYDCLEANKLSTRKRKEPRTYKGIDYNDLKQIDSIVTKGVKLGQSLHHIYIVNSFLADICSERTIRRYIYRGYLNVRAHELPRYVRFSHKYDYSEKKIINVERMLGRTFSDCFKYIEEHPSYYIWEYDSVEGKIIDKKAILTITFIEFRFQFGLLISKQNMRSVYCKIRTLQKILGSRYKEIFQINLSDNGIEFTKFHELEKDENGNELCRTFFTNPYRATDKSHCERNHEFIRYVLPKGKSLDFLTQEKVNLLFSHINSYVRESNKNKTPYALMVERFGVEFVEALGIKPINPREVCLKPSLLK